MDKNQTIFTLNIDIKAFDALIEFHINKAVAAAFEKIESKKSIVKPQDEWITRKQATEILGISAPTIINLSKSGILPCYRLGKSVRYKRIEVDNAMKLSFSKRK